MTYKLLYKKLTVTQALNKLLKYRDNKTIQIHLGPWYHDWNGGYSLDNLNLLASKQGKNTYKKEPRPAYQWAGSRLSVPRAVAGGRPFQGKKNRPVITNKKIDVVTTVKETELNYQRAMLEIVKRSENISVVYNSIPYNSDHEVIVSLELVANNEHEQSILNSAIYSIGLARSVLMPLKSIIVHEEMGYPLNTVNGSVPNASYEAQELLKTIGNDKASIISIQDVLNSDSFKRVKSAKKAIEAYKNGGGGVYQTEETVQKRDQYINDLYTKQEEQEIKEAKKQAKQAKKQAKQAS